jgi:hypothetical protein
VWWTTTGAIREMVCVQVLKTTKLFKIEINFCREQFPLLELRILRV